MKSQTTLSRRGLLAGAAGVAAMPAIAHAQAPTAGPSPNAQLSTPASTITNPPRDWKEVGTASRPVSAQ
jgi:hypothetical protein